MDHPAQCFPSSNVYTILLGILLNADSDSVGLGWSLKSWISIKLPDNVDAAILRTTLRVARA